MKHTRMQLNQFSLSHRLKSSGGLFTLWQSICNMVSKNVTRFQYYHTVSWMVSTILVNGPLMCGCVCVFKSRHLFSRFLMSEANLKPVDGVSAPGFNPAH
mmetsp:Transcript_5879/g.11233  ORF Transcript_5879/g.11233 Transcript_5879/m.11233 type:complete len:100 (+) Transcript_5879:81-380(+)